MSVHWIISKDFLPVQEFKNQLQDTPAILQLDISRALIKSQNFQMLATVIQVLESDYIIY